MLNKVQQSPIHLQTDLLLQTFCTYPRIREPKVRGTPWSKCETCCRYFAGTGIWRWSAIWRVEQWQNCVARKFTKFSIFKSQLLTLKAWLTVLSVLIFMLQTAADSIFLQMYKSVIYYTSSTDLCGEMKGMSRRTVATNSRYITPAIKVHWILILSPYCLSIST